MTSSCRRASPAGSASLPRDVTPVAVVTGAARGIGAATVRLLTAREWRVVAVDACSDDDALGYPLASRDELEALRADRVEPVVADVRDPRALGDAVAAATMTFGGLDAAIAAAGVIAGGAAHWLTSDAVDHTIVDVNLGGVLNLARATVPAMLQRPEPRRGRFVAVASVAATRGMPGLAAYSGAKAGVTGFVRGLAADLRGTGITANAVSPGSTDTAMLAESARLYGLDDAQQFAAQQPIERLLSPEEVAHAIAWLLSDEASGVTGVTLPVDGGLSL